MNKHNKRQKHTKEEQQERRKGRELAKRLHQALKTKDRDKRYSSN